MKKIILSIFIVVFIFSACSGTGELGSGGDDKLKKEDSLEKGLKSSNSSESWELGEDSHLDVKASSDDSLTKEKEVEKFMNYKKENIRTIYLAGGCFWGVEGYFSKLNGVVDAVSGYANGDSDDTDYQRIDSTGHAETVKIDYDISMISLEELLLHYFKIIDPKSLNKQGNDIGTQYRTGSRGKAW